MLADQLERSDNLWGVPRKEMVMIQVLRTSQLILCLGELVKDVHVVILLLESEF